MPLDARKYWTQQMEAAYAFMQRVLSCPLAECREPLVCLKDLARSAGVEIFFPPGKHLGMFERLFSVRRSLAEPILRAARAFLKRGWVLRIEDAYRSPEAQVRSACSDYVVRTVLKKVRWELQGAEPDTELVFRRLAVWSATTPIFANHTSGSAVDVSMLSRSTGGRLDLGAPYPELSPRTPMDSPFISGEARRNRRLVCELLAAEGFAPYPYEFWHFSCGDADYEVATSSGRAARFGPVNLSPTDGRATPVPDVRKPFVTPQDIRRRLRQLATEKKG